METTGGCYTYVFGSYRRSDHPPVGWQSDKKGRLPLDFWKCVLCGGSCACVALCFFFPNVSCEKVKRGSERGKMYLREFCELGVSSELYWLHLYIYELM